MGDINTLHIENVHCIIIPNDNAQGITTTTPRHRDWQQTLDAPAGEVRITAIKNFRLPLFWRVVDYFVPQLVPPTVVMPAKGVNLRLLGLREATVTDLDADVEIGTLRGRFGLGKVNSLTVHMHFEGRATAAEVTGTLKAIFADKAYLAVDGGAISTANVSSTHQLTLVVKAAVTKLEAHAGKNSNVTFGMVDYGKIDCGSASHLTITGASKRLNVAVGAESTVFIDQVDTLDLTCGTSTFVEIACVTNRLIAKLDSNVHVTVKEPSPQPCDVRLELMHGAKLYLPSPIASGYINLTGGATLETPHIDRTKTTVSGDGNVRIVKI